MKSKGFTLIELLAVIVILAVIALIATPAVLNIIEDSKRSAAEDSARVISKAAETHYVSNVTLQGEEVGTINLTSDTLKYKGEKPEKGYVSFDEKGNAYLKMYINGYCVESNYDNTVTSTKTENEECEMNTVVVPLEVDGGILEVATIKYEAGEALGELPVPTKKGYEFLGWYDGNGNPVTANTVVVKGLTLNAKWQAKTYTVTFKSDGAVVETRTVTYGEAYGNLPLVLKDGYTFEWQVNGVKITYTTLVTVDGNHEVVAKWQIEPTYIAKLYFNPVTNSECSDYNATTNSKNRFIGTSENGCMLWYAYKEENGNYLMLADHNTSSGMAWESMQTEIVNIRDNNTYGWHADVISTIRLIGAQEIADLIPDRDSSWTTSRLMPLVFQPKSDGQCYEGPAGTNKYGWLMDNLDGCEMFGCNIEQDGDTVYWTSTRQDSQRSWAVERAGFLNCGLSDFAAGLRPVISVPKSKFTN